jgi:hypothetical protein
MAIHGREGIGRSVRTVAIRFALVPGTKANLIACEWYRVTQSGAGLPWNVALVPGTKATLIAAPPLGLELSHTADTVSPST